MSSPNSPVHDTRHTVSNPYDLNQVEPCECITPSGEREILMRGDKAATIPRTQNESGTSGQKSRPRGILKLSSTSSPISYDSSSGTQSSTLSPSKGVGSHGYQGQRSASTRPLSSDNLSKSDGFSSLGKPNAYESIRVETAFVGGFEDSSCDMQKANGRKSVTIASTPEEHHIDPSTPDDSEKSNTPVTVHKDCIRILAPQPQKLLPESPRGSHHSESPEWPSPPEPLTPQTPQTPTYNLEFDSDSIKRMLENLPMSPETDSVTGSIHEQDQGFHEEGEKGVETDQQCSNDKTSDNSQNLQCKSLACDNNSDEQSTESLRLLDCEIARRRGLRDSYGRDSNPDSGIGGMQCDTAVSLSSSDSNNLPAVGKCANR